MEITYTWDILFMNVDKVNDLDNVAVSAYWACVAVSQDYQKGATNRGLANLNAPDPENFQSYENLTKEQVLEWLFSGAIDKQKIEADLAIEVENMVTTTSICLAPPWIKPDPFSEENSTEQSQELDQSATTTS